MEAHMISVFSPVPQLVVKPFHTQPLLAGSVRSVAVAAAVIRKHFIDDSQWLFEIRKGSLTLRHCEERHKVVKVFVDYGQKLTAETGAHIHAPDPVAIGVELTHQDPVIAESVRDKLTALFGRNYLDPRSGYPIWYLQPQQMHAYDIILLDDGPCQFEADDDLINRIEAQIREGMAKSTDDSDE